MPDKTGLDMIREMKEILPDAAYILLSGYQARREREEKSDS
ncbi:response regulator [Streptococcus pneumoniae]|nr:response regulator [Streptococcus pneumoniae]